MKKVFLIATVLTLISACKSKQDATNTLEEMQSSEEINLPDMHTSQTSLDYQGAYYGLLPCADCMGIQLKLTINNDSTYTTESIYLGKSNEIFTKEGKYNWDKFGREIICRIDNQIVARYKVEENRIVQFGQQGKIDGETEARYNLYKNPKAIWNKLWFANSIKGKKIEQIGVIPNLTFLPNGRVFGSGGCNQLQANYSLNENQTIKISTVSSTKRGCGDIRHYDFELSEAMTQAKSYEVVDNQLYLKDSSQEIIAKFKAQTID